MTKNNHTTYVDEIDAKGGRRVNTMLYVLGLSLLGIVSLGFIVYISFAV